MSIKRVSAKPKKMRKITAVALATIFTLAGVNIAHADTSIDDFGDLKSFIGAGGSGTTGNLTGNITASSNIGAVARSGLTLNGAGYTISGNNTYSGFELGNSITSFVLKDVAMQNFKKTGGDYTNGGAINNAGTISNIGITDHKTIFTGNSSIGTKSDEDYIVSAVVDGGAIYNEGKITNITANFDSNSVTASATANDGETTAGAYGGAISNYIYTENEVETNVINNITGEFKNNFATATAASTSGSAEATASGGAINNSYSAYVYNMAHQQHH